MRIGIDGMLLGRRHSGVETSIARLVRELAAHGAHAYRLYADEGSAAGLPAGGRVIVSPVRVPLHSRVLRMLWEQAALPRVALRDGIDLLHAPGYVAPLRAKMPVVVTVYDAIALVAPRLCAPGNRWHYRAMLPLSLRKAAVVIVPSEATRRDVERCVPAAAGKTRVIPLGVDAAFRPVHDAEARQRVRDRYGLGERFVLFVGRTETKKNLPRLVEAFGLLRRDAAVSHQLAIAGAPSWGQATLERAVRRHGLAGAVRCTGFVPPEDLPALYSLADLFVFPSLYEGFGLPPLEAMACGTPVMVSNRGALPETAGPAALVVDPLSAAAMAAAMRRVLTDRALRDDLVARGLRHAQPLTWARAAAATDAVYAEAVRP